MPIALQEFDFEHAQVLQNGLDVVYPGQGQQILTRIKQDGELSKQITLWNQNQSSLLWGNLLVLPITGCISTLFLPGAPCVAATRRAERKGTRPA